MVDDGRDGDLAPDVLDLARDVVGLLRERGEVLGTAESLTGGLLSGAVTSVPGSSAASAAGPGSPGP